MSGNLVSSNDADVDDDNVIPIYGLKIIDGGIKAFDNKDSISLLSNLIWSDLISYIIIYGLWNIAHFFLI